MVSWILPSISRTWIMEQLDLTFVSIWFWKSSADITISMEFWGHLNFVWDIHGQLMTFDCLVVYHHDTLSVCDSRRRHVLARITSELALSILRNSIIPTTYVFPKIGVPQNGWFTMDNPIKMDDLGVPYFWKHPYLFWGGLTTVLLVVSSPSHLYIWPWYLRSLEQPARETLPINIFSWYFPVWNQVKLPKSNYLELGCCDWPTCWKSPA